MSKVPQESLNKFKHPDRGMKGGRMLAKKIKDCTKKACNFFGDHKHAIFNTMFAVTAAFTIFNNVSGNSSQNLKRGDILKLGNNAQATARTVTENGSMVVELNAGDEKIFNTASSYAKTFEKNHGGNEKTSMAFYNIYKGRE